jgi:hypothetical protein
MDKFKLEIKWGLIFVAMSLIWVALERMVGLHDTYIEQHAIYTNLVAIPSILIFVLALREKRNKFYGGSMTYTQGLVSGIIISLIVALLSPLTQWLVATVITPEYFTNAIAYAVGTGKLNQEQAEGFFNLQSYMAQGALGASAMGFLTSAVVTLFIKKK